MHILTRGPKIVIAGKGNPEGSNRKAPKMTEIRTHATLADFTDQEVVPALDGFDGDVDALVEEIRS